MGLLGPDGRPITTTTFQNKKADPPKTGPAFGQWAGRDLQFATLPGGGVVQFDLSKLTLEDFRAMRDHYQVNASLAVLSFMQHQSEFTVECENKAIADFCNEQLHRVWTMLNRALSTANWAGYAPNVLEWENNYTTKSLDLAKVKDLVPEECKVNWKEVEQWAPPGRTPPKAKVYDGITQFGVGWPYPSENTFWYPLLMENGDYYGKKLLKPAFQSWFFSILLHLFANRYYERFGEPVPIGRAPFDDVIDVDGSEYQGNTFMLSLLQKLRSRGAVVLPNTHEKTQTGQPVYDYDIKYLEGQMRGADFERYMTRLDEEISLGLFTPILLMRTADVGSYNLGQGHMQVYLWMLNAMNDDRAFYIDNYILSRMVDYNFSPKAPRAKIKFRKLGKGDADMVKQVLLALVKNKQAKPDLEELGQLAGMTLKEIRQTTSPSPAPAADPNADPNAAPGGDQKPPAGNTLRESRATGKEISARVRQQVEAAWRDNRFDENLRVNMGFKRRFERALEADGISDSISKTNRLYGRMDNWLADIVTLGADEFSGPDSFMGIFDKVLDVEIGQLNE